MRIDRTFSRTPGIPVLNINILVARPVAPDGEGRQLPPGYGFASPVRIGLLNLRADDRGANHFYLI